MFNKKTKLSGIFQLKNRGSLRTNDRRADGWRLDERDQVFKINNLKTYEGIFVIRSLNRPTASININITSVPDI
jgi:hypothetical protein